MFTRIVKMVFRPEELDNFLKIFEESAPKIRAFAGCEYLELLQDQQNPTIMMTRSMWASEEALENYRHSALFKSTWAETKQLFAEKPQAWSVDTLYRFNGKA